MTAREILRQVENGSYRVPPEKAVAVMRSLFPKSRKWNPDANPEPATPRNAPLEPVRGGDHQRGDAT